MIRPKNKKISHAGFALVEMLFYVAILVTVSLAAIYLMLSLRTLLDQYQAEERVVNSARVALERMMLDIRSADSIDTVDPDNTLVTSPGHLVLVDGATTTEFYLSGGQIMVKVNEVLKGPLTRSDVTVDELRFFSYDNSVTEAVRVQLTLSANTNTATATETFRSTAVMRGSYGG